MTEEPVQAKSPLAEEPVAPLQEHLSSHGPQVRKVRWFIGIIGTIALLLTGVGNNILQNRTTKSIVTNYELLQQSGNNPADFAEMPERLDSEFIFLVLGAAILTAYLLTVLVKRRRGALVLLFFVILYFLIVRLDSALTLTGEEQVRGLTAGAWAVKMGLELFALAVEMLIVSQGWVALRPKRNKKNAERKPVGPPDRYSAESL